jgi:hypothetical protein
LPLSERARIELYLPDVDRPEYQDLLSSLQSEFTYTFSGSSVVRGVDGAYLSRSGHIMTDRVNILYSDATIDPDKSFETISEYADHLRDVVNEALREEAVLVVVHKVFHSVNVALRRPGA